MCLKKVAIDGQVLFLIGFNNNTQTFFQTIKKYI